MATPRTTPQTLNRPKRDIPRALREAVLTADACRYCADIVLPREVEHQVPLSRGGTNNPDNLVAACVSCNTQKRSMLVSEWRVYRTTHGMPWPPLASHATDTRHFGHRCAECSHAFHAANRGLGGRGPGHLFIVRSHRLEVVRAGVYRCHHLCPAGHFWARYYHVDAGYFSDCPCAYCWNRREDAGDKHWPAPDRYQHLAP